MTRVERYEEDGSPIYAPDEGSLQILWDSLAKIHEVKNEEGVEKSAKFAIDEFFKLLYLTRAELDICASTLDLVDKVDANNVELKAVNYQALPSKANVPNYSSKFDAIRSAAAKLKAKAAELKQSTAVEHDIVANQFLKLRKDFSWPVKRIMHAKQLSIYFDPAELTPVACINFSPGLLFPQSAERFAPPEAVNPAHLAIIFRDQKGSLSLRLQELDQKSLCISQGDRKCFINLAIDESASESIKDWDSILQKVRYCLLAQMAADKLERDGISISFVDSVDSENDSELRRLFEGQICHILSNKATL